MCWTRTRRIYEAKAVTRSLSHARVSINEAADDDGGYTALADTETANDPRVGKQVLHIAVMKLVFVRMCFTGGRERLKPLSPISRRQLCDNRCRCSCSPG